jgi:5-carboxymethyl-2-hydroxymuconic-semialdehyde dehydrogenase
MADLATHMATLKVHLARFHAGGIMNLIGGQDTPGSGGVFETRSPVDDSLICTVARSDDRDIDRAARAAKAAFPAWAALDGAARRVILHRIADGIDARAEEIALCECWDTGQAYRRDGRSLPTATHLNVTSRAPIGPVGVITPWNTPFMLSTWKIAPALAAGCTVVHKPAEFSPLTARLLAEICHEAGLPPGVLNLVNGFGEDAGRALTEHPDIKAIAFVGESKTGSMIMRQGAETLKRVHFELGGKNPVVVFDDADIERALDAVIFMIYSLNGERCTSSSRLLVQDTIATDFHAALIARVNKIKVGHPLDPATEVGPLIHKTHFDKVMGYVGIGQAEGATLAAGGVRVGDAGYFMRPTLFTDATPDMRIAQEEVFGPFLTSLTFADEAEALNIANGVGYGLTGYVWTADLTRAMRFSERLEAGMIWVNSENVRHLPTPFGGVKASGIGRDGDPWSFDFYMETKNTAFATGLHKIQRLGV